MTRPDDDQSLRSGGVAPQDSLSTRLMLDILRGQLRADNGRLVITLANSQRALVGPTTFLQRCRPAESALTPLQLHPILSPACGGLVMKRRVKRGKTPLVWRVVKELLLLEHLFPLPR